MLVDSHCHLTDDRFQEDRAAVLRRAREAGVEKVLSIASDASDALRVLDLVSEMVGSGLPGLWGTAGVHPHEAEGTAEGDMDRIRQVLQADHRMVAVGETGMDFHYDHSPRELQETLFRDHLTLAEELNLPIVVHSRSADALTERILREWGSRVRGVLHCYTGGSELLETAVDVGWMISFTGIITFKKFQDHALVRRVPRDRLMVETDAPYLAPVPHRGRRNEPAYVARVAEVMAEIRGEDLSEVLAYTSSNAESFFGLTP